MKKLRPNEERAKAAIALLWIVMAMDIISLISGYFQYDLLQSVANGNNLSLAEADANDTREMLIGILYIVIFIVSAVTFIQWFRRAYFNLHLKVRGLSETEGWAAGAWFVPIISLYKPYHIMKELYEKTKQLFNTNKIKDNGKLDTSILGWWWALWIISNIVGQAVFRISLRAETVDELISSTIADMVMSVIGIPLAYLAIQVVKNYSEIEPLLKNATIDKNFVPQESISTTNENT